MKTILINSLLIIFSFQLSAQSSLQGSVIDDKNDPIFFATVALYNTSDSTVVKAESTDASGNFEITGIKEGEYYLTASMLSYADQTLGPFSVPSNASYDFSLSTDANLLSTIEIKSKAPLMEQRGEKLIVNVEGNITNTSGSLLDVMKKVPGMLVIRDRLSLAGSGSPTILLNGKSTQYVDIQALLKDMPGDNIKTVEIIHQPGAEYEASGSGPIINIILKKNSLFGTNGSVTVGVGRGQLWDYNTGLNLSHYAGNFNISGGIGYSVNAYSEELIITRTLTDIDDSLNGIYDQYNLDENTPRTYRGNLRMDWDATDRHRIGLSTKYFNNSNEYTATNNTTVSLFTDGGTDFTLDTDNAIDQGWTYNSLNPYYIFEIDTAGQKLELDLSYSRFQIDGVNTLTTTNNIDQSVQAQRYDQPGDSKIYASTLDYTLPLNKDFTLKTGVKYSEAELDNNLISDELIAGIWKQNLDQTNHFLFDETIMAAYSKVNWTYGEWSGSAGLRYENSESIGNSLTLDSIQFKTISKFFPSFSLSRKIAGPLKATLSYSKRINRPRYSNLNPFIYYLDPFTSERGNPTLRPQLTNSSKFTLSYEGQPFFNVEYKTSSDAIVEVTEQETFNEEAFKTDVNFDNQTIFSTSLFFPLDFIPGVEGYGGGILTRNSYDSEYIGAQFDRSQWNTTFFIQAEFELPAEIQAEVGGWYTSSSQEGIFNSEYLYGTSLGFSKKFLDSKMKVSLGVEDFTNRFWHATVDYQQDVSLLATWQAPTASLRISYKFGNQHLKSKKKTAGSASEELRRASQGK